MSSFQDSISNVLDDFKRSIYNQSFDWQGSQVRVVRLQVEENDYGDETIELLDHSEINLTISNLEDIPQSRLRKNLAQTSVISTTSNYLFDILPLEIETSLDDRVERGDIIVKPMKDETDNKPFYLVLRVLEPIGSFSPNSLLKLKFNTAPYLAKFDQNIIDVIESYDKF